MAAVAVLLVNSVMNVPIRHIPANATIGLPLHIVRIPCDIHSAIPVSWIAVPRLMLPANIIRSRQSILSRACDIVQKRQMIMAKAAMNAACSNVRYPNEDTTIIATIINDEYKVRISGL